MRARNKTNKVLDIALSEEKFYFPGETIRGLSFLILTHS